MSVTAFCAGCRREIAPAELPAAVVIHPDLRLWEVVHTLHHNPRCFTAYWLKRPVGAPMPTDDPLTVAEFEEVAGVRVVGSGDDRGYARLEPRRRAS